ncbi:hypothetical protein L1049_016707 [Liquidambar formosana]|uniref:Uncharacterized protein n=1 Tax=Liquidambar formosana TaxID=63359 RepID=A0AAP0S6H3_LIQFO
MRSNLQAMTRLISELNLQERHVHELQRTPFWDFFRPFVQGKVKLKCVKKFDEDVVKILKTYTPTYKGFQISDELLSLRSSDFVLIFGIHTGAEDITLGVVKKPNQQLVDWICAGEKRLNPPAIERLLLQSLQKTGKEDSEDVARLLCLYAFVTVFFPTSGTQLSWSYVPYVENLDDMKKYNWPSAIKSYLEASIQKLHNTQNNVTSCVIAVLGEIGDQRASAL